MSYVGALPVPNAAQSKEGLELSSSASGRMILLSARVGGENFWALVDDVHAAFKAAPTAGAYLIKKVLSDAERAKGLSERKIGVSREDVLAVIAKFSLPKTKAEAGKEIAAKKLIDDKTAAAIARPTLSRGEQNTIFLVGGAAAVAALALLLGGKKAR